MNDFPKNRASKSGGLEPVSLAREHADSPLSFGQERLWILQQLQPSDRSHTLCFAVRLGGSIPLASLERMGSYVVERHEILRTTFPAPEGVPFQHVAAATRVQIPVVEVENPQLEGRRKRFEEAVRAGLERSRDLAAGPLFQLALARFSQAEWALYCVAHHIVCDSWSISILLREILELRRSILRRESSPLRPLTWQYQDFARHQRAQLTREKTEQLASYWLPQLADLTGSRILIDRRGARSPSWRGAIRRFSVSPKIYRDLRRLSRAEGVTLFATLLACFKVLLYRYSSEGDIAVATQINGRNRPELEEMIGFFANTLILRTDLSDNPIFRSLLRRVRDVVFDALRHQEMPFERLTQLLNPIRDLSGPPLTGIGFVFDRQWIDPRDFPSGLEPVEIDAGTSTMDLSLFARAGNDLSLAFEYKVDLFCEDYVQELQDRFLCLIKNILADPDRPIDDIPLVAPAVRQKRIERGLGWQQAHQFSSVCEDIERHCERRPDAPAVVLDGAPLSYRELTRRAGYLAKRLRRLGVRKDVCVGVFMERSLELPVAILGVLKAGGAFVPLDPCLPADRIRRMVSSCRPVVVLTQQKLRGRSAEIFGDLAHSSRATLVVIDDPDTLKGPDPFESGARRISPRDLAYVIFTSGSTGEPKGVMVEHRSLANHMRWMLRQFPLAAHDSVLQRTPMSFDASIWELFAPLMSGGRLVMARPEGQHDCAYLVETIQKERVTTVQFVPSILRLVLEEPGLRSCRSLRRVFCGGEILTADLQSAFYAQSQAELYNLYGPTEACIDVTFHHCSREECDRDAPLGTAIDNMEVYVLGPDLEPTPDGVPGELCIGGIGLARGYLDSLRLNSEKFIQNPFQRDPGSLLYRSGDRARFLSGRLEFCGRVDDQLKINGVRVEPGEIETVLADHAAVDRAVVRDWSPPDSPARILVAYLVASETGLPEPGELRTFLRERLPFFLVPSRFVEIERVPTTPSGKTDFGALPPPSPCIEPKRSEFVAPRNEEERLLVRVWSEVLQLEAIGVGDNFFDLGGASIQTIQVAVRLTRRGYRLAPEAIFRHQTIAQLAQALSREDTDGALAEIPGFDPDRFFPKGRDVILERKGNRERVPRATSVIESLGVYLPQRQVITDDVVRGCSRRIQLPLKRLTGIESRPVAGETEFSIDLAKKAVSDCLSRSAFGPRNIDLLICCNISRYDGPGRISQEPSTAIRLKQELGFARAMTFDVTNACAGLFTGILIGDALLSLRSFQTCMVVSGEYITHLTQTAQKEIEEFLDDRLACLTLGDAGAALILEPSRDGKTGFHLIEMFTMGRYSPLCVAKATDQPHGGAIMRTDMVQVSATATRHSTLHAAEVLQRGGWQIAEFDHLIPHQTSRNSLRGAAREINRLTEREICSEENVIDNLTHRGNTASTSHCVTVWDCVQGRRINTNDRALFNITGSGQTVGTALYTFDDLPERIRRATRPQPRPTRSAGSSAIRVGRKVRIASAGRSRLNREPASAIELARQAAEDCLKESSHERSEIGLVIHSGVYREEFLCEPALAAILAGRLKINPDMVEPSGPRTLAFDLVNGSLGFLNACFVATQLLELGKCEAALITASEIENNRTVQGKPLMGLEETGSAVLLDRSPDGQTGFDSFLFLDFSEHVDAFTSHATHPDGKTFLKFDRDPSFGQLCLECIPGVAMQLLEDRGLAASDVSLLIPPQPTADFPAALAQRLGFDLSRVVCLECENDLSTSSLPAGFRQAMIQGLATPGELGLLIGVSPGVQVGCALYRF